jgi:hypothetical protein
MSDAQLAARHLAEVKAELTAERARSTRLSKQVVRARARARRLDEQVALLRELLAEALEGVVTGSLQGSNRVVTAESKGKR